VAAVTEVAEFNAQGGQLRIPKEDVEACKLLLKSSKYTSTNVLNAWCVKGGGWDPVAIEILKPESDPIGSQQMYDAFKDKCAATLTMPITRYIKGLWRVKPLTAFGPILKEAIVEEDIALGEDKPEAAAAGEIALAAWNRAVRHYAWLQQLKADMEPKAAAAAAAADTPKSQ